MDEDHGCLQQRGDASAGILTVDVFVAAKPRPAWFGSPLYRGEVLRNSAFLQGRSAGDEASSLCSLIDTIPPPV
jgi:hypothetical protein